MKTRHVTLFLAGISSLALIGCKPKENPPAPTTSVDRAADTVAKTARDAAATTGDAFAAAWDKVKDATYDERAQVRASLDQLSTSVDAKMNELQARSASASAATRDEWNRGLEKLHAACEDFHAEVKDLEQATAETWDHAKAEVAAAWEQVRRSYSDLEAQRTSS